MLNFTSVHALNTHITKLQTKVFSVESFTDWKFTQLIITLVYFISSILHILCFSNVNVTANLAFKHNAESVIAIIQLEN